MIHVPKDHLSELGLYLLLDYWVRQLIRQVLPGWYFIEKDQPVFVAEIHEHVVGRIVTANGIGAHPLQDLDILSDDVWRNGRAPIRVIVMAVRASYLEGFAIKQDSRAIQGEGPDAEACVLVVTRLRKVQSG